MKKTALPIWLVLLLAGILFLAAGTAAGEGKTVGMATITNGLDGTYLCNFRGDSRVLENGGGWGLMLFPEGAWSDDSQWEPARKAEITLLSGDEALKDAFVIVDDIADEKVLMCQLDSLKAEGEATFRVDMESEHYQASETFTARFVDFSKVQISLDFDVLSIPLGVETRLGDVIDIRQVHVEPDVGNVFFYAADRDGNMEAETQEYRLFYSGITLLQEGDYPMQVILCLGENGIWVAAPVTYHAQTEAEAEAAWQKRWEAAQAEKTEAGFVYGDLTWSRT